MKSFLKTALFVAIATLAALGLAGQVHAQPPTPDQIRVTEASIRSDGKYAVLVSNTQHLNAAITTGRSFKARSQGIDFQIVACGPLVKDIATDPALKDKVIQAVDSDGLKIVVCGMSVTQQKIDPTTLPAATPTTENGLEYLFGLQEQGYQTIAV